MLAIGLDHAIKSLFGIRVGETRLRRRLTGLAELNCKK